MPTMKMMMTDNNTDDDGGDNACTERRGQGHNEDYYENYVPLSCV